mgnify:CR=1 FL=1
MPKTTSSNWQRGRPIHHTRLARPTPVCGGWGASLLARGFDWSQHWAYIRAEAPSAVQKGRHTPGFASRRCFIRADSWPQFGEAGEGDELPSRGRGTPGSWHRQRNHRPSRHGLRVKAWTGAASSASAGEDCAARLPSWPQNSAVHPGLRPTPCVCSAISQPIPTSSTPSGANRRYRQALTLAEARGMRPLVAHRHLGLRNATTNGPASRGQAGEAPCHGNHSRTERWTCGSGWSERRRRRAC